MQGEQKKPDTFESLIKIQPVDEKLQTFILSKST